MKDYYKILGVKESASEEEIREHWIERIRKLHPDQHQELRIEDERIRAVNGAYQVLKHSSTRVEYDLKRAHDRRRKGFPVRRISIPIVVFCFVLIPALLYVKKAYIGVPPVSSTEHPTIVLREAVRQDPEVLRNGTIEPLNAGHLEVVDTTAQEAPGVETGPASKSEPDGKRIGPKPGRHRPADERRNSIGPKIFDKEVRAKKADRPQEELGIPAPEWIQVSSAPVPLEAGVNVLPWIEGPDWFALPNEEVGEPSADDPVSMAASAPQKGERAAPLLAGEDEVRGFLSLYAERYMQKDLEGFLSLFSQRAVQNGKDGFERIRAIYADFLHRSKEIRYRLYDAKIEIYQNGVEVKSRYELTQRPGAGGRERAWRGQIRWVLTKENGALKVLSLDYQSQETR
ncbi:MAG: hypothetical protein A2170_05075 [Deltaproteobacteria bacterium RBG_13_53_10]|nr:MAG: hypothetical protein A2170_05075 [Deltaproteobacteria bacterium RBG_13_53_10]